MPYKEDDNPEYGEQRREFPPDIDYKHMELRILEQYREPISNFLNSGAEEKKEQ